MGYHFKPRYPGLINVHEFKNFESENHAPDLPPVGTHHLSDRHRWIVNLSYNGGTPTISPDIANHEQGVIVEKMIEDQVLGQYQISAGQEVSLIQGDLTLQKVDAIVNAANP
ncbi:MAG: hypothetical protein ACK2T7_07490, partial [Anaerolineales bacterium]